MSRPTDSQRVVNVSEGSRIEDWSDMVVGNGLMGGIGSTLLSVWNCRSTEI